MQETKVKQKTSETFECSLYIGSREHYDGPKFEDYNLIQAIQFFQESCGENICPVRVMPCTFVCGLEYEENGFQVSAVVYPNSKKTKEEVHDFMHKLAEHLLDMFKQNRISVMTYESKWPTVMYECERAENRNRHK